MRKVLRWLILKFRIILNNSVKCFLVCCRHLWSTSQEKFFKKYLQCYLLCRFLSLNEAYFATIPSEYVSIPAFQSILISKNSWQIWAFSDRWVFVYELSGCGFEFHCCHPITMLFRRLVIHFWGQFFKNVILWPIFNPSFWHHSKTGSKEDQICISSTISEKS